MAHAMGIETRYGFRESRKSCMSLPAILKASVYGARGPLGVRAEGQGCSVRQKQPDVGMEWN